ncbi:MAG: hypothetical protein AAF636_23400 [Pseudomonadota bacterium]
MDYIQFAKARRADALKLVRADRILVAPTTRIQDLRFPKKGSVGDYLINRLAHGATEASIGTEMNCSNATVMTYLFRTAKRTGVGIERRKGKLWLLLPEDMDNMKTVNPEVAEISKAGAVKRPHYASTRTHNRP